MEFRAEGYDELAGNPEAGPRVGETFCNPCEAYGLNRDVTRFCARLRRPELVLAARERRRRKEPAEGRCHERSARAVRALEQQCVSSRAEETPERRGGEDRI